MKRSIHRFVAFLLLVSLVISMIPAVSAADATQSATLVTDVSSLQAGDQIIIVAAGYDYALSTTQNTNNRGQAAITKNADNTVTFGADTQVITLVSGSVDGTFAFDVGDSKYLYAASSSANNLKSSTSLSDNASWAVTIDADTGVASVVASGDKTRNIIRYNASASLFSCYAAGNTQKNICIYEVGGAASSLVSGVVTDVSTLQAGDQIIIAAADYDYALGTTQNTSNRGQAAVVKNTDGSITYYDDAQVITLETGSVSGTFTFNVGDSQYLYAPSSSANQLKTTTSPAENACWTITIDSTTGSAAITANGGVTRNILRYNTSSGLFSCYAKGNTQKDICIYEVTGTTSGGSGSGSGSGDTGSTTNEVSDAGNIDGSCNHNWSNGSCSICGEAYILMITNATGYTSASDVVYNTVNGYTTNWGARGEECLFLSTYAQNFYTTGYTYDVLSAMSGGTSADNAASSELYAALQTLMTDNHTTFTRYGSSSTMNCKDLYMYTDCLRNDTNYVSTIYRGLYVAGAWDSGVTYNQEHIWPNSKCIGSESTDVGDIMHLRPANPGENSSRNNTAYGESSGYYDPGQSVRGDCARTLLYLYTRWGNTQYMWGTDGVMESLDILLRWIEEDPVDTWEMGHNDAVESITGTRNVFVDYPEYAYLLFGEEIPATLDTPSDSGSSGSGIACSHSYSSSVTTAATCTTAGVRTYTCSKCSASYTESITPTGHSYSSSVTTAATCTTAGVRTYTCSNCGDSYTESITPAGHSYANGFCTTCGAADPSYDPDYYLVGYINGADYGCEGDYANLGAYKFVNGTLTATFNSDSYVFIKTGDNANWYMTKSYVTDTTATLYNTTTGTSEKLFVPGGVEVTFTLVKNSDGSLTLSYAVSASVVPTLTPHHPSLSFESEIFINVYFNATNIDDVVEMGLVTSADATVDENDTKIPGYEHYSDTMYIARTNGISAKNLGDTIYFRTYAKLADGTYVYSEKTYNYSALDYAKDRLANSTSTKMKALAVAMLNYGAAAQTHFGYNANNLMNASLTADQLALVDAYRSDMVAGVSGVASSKVGSFAYNSAGYTSRYPSVSFEGAFSINYYFTPALSVDNGMTLYYWTQAAYDSASVLTAANATGKIEMTYNGTSYEGTVGGIAAKDIDATIFVAGVYESNGVSYSTGVLPYSLGGYCVDRINNSTVATMVDFAKATAVYGYYAKEYFAA